ncbi:hypothetical protein Btru_037646 [Bulinus truncatus]|nr:hypothetical protein Btru_037646 [Bulinus truncatus]
MKLMTKFSWTVLKFAGLKKQICPFGHTSKSNSGMWYWWSLGVIVLTLLDSSNQQKKITGTLLQDNHLQCVIRVYYCEAQYEYNISSIESLNMLLNCYKLINCKRSTVTYDFWNARTQLVKNLISDQDLKFVSAVSSCQGTRQVPVVVLVLAVVYNTMNYE